MKKMIIILTCLIVLAFTTGILLSLYTQKSCNHDYLRIHIRANSNDKEDQAVKQIVREEITNYLVPIVANSSDINETKSKVSKNLDKLSELTTAVLQQNGFSYVATAKLNREFFPTRSYDNVTLEEGLYDALIIELGEAKGDNWWCVVYPPLCFVGAENNGTNEIKYKSKLKEIIEKYIYK